jgi:glycosyltransferase involved in cell wall biosynthesis
MKIYIQMMSSCAPSWGFGGPIRIFYDYINYLNPHTTSYVFSGDVHHDYKKISSNNEISNFPVTRVKVFLKFLCKKNINLISPKMFFLVSKIIKGSNSKVTIHICETRGLINIYAALLKTIYGDRIQLIHSAFGMLHKTDSRIRKVYDMIFFNWTFNNIDVFLAQNKHELNEYHTLFRLNKNLSEDNKKFELLPLNINKFANHKYINKHQDIIKSARKSFSLPDDHIIFLFLGRFHENKGLINAHNVALEYSIKCNVPVCMVFAGRDEGFLENIKDLSSNNLYKHYKIKIIENIYGDDRFELYQAADIFLGLPLIYEETMLSSLEALSVGTPCLISEHASIPYLEEIKAGFEISVDLKDSSQFIETILKDYESFSRNALRLIQKTFLIENVGSSLNKILIDEK